MRKNDIIHRILSITFRNNNVWNSHLCGLNSYIFLIILIFLPVSIAASSSTFLQHFVTDFGIKVKGLSLQERTQLKDSFFAIITNFIYPILIYVKNDKLRRFVKEEFLSLFWKYKNAFPIPDLTFNSFFKKVQAQA